MALAFVTTTQSHYRYTPQAALARIRQERYYPECYGKKEEWYRHEDAKVDFRKLEIAVKNQHIKRVSTSTYRNDYCKIKGWKPPIIGEDSDKPKETGDFYLIDTFRPVYQKNTDLIKLLPALQSSRNIYGFLTKLHMYNPMSSMQDVHGKLGFDLLEKAHQKKMEAKAKKMEARAKEMERKTKN